MESELARRLWNARLQGELIQLSEVELPPDEVTAYAVQAAQLPIAGEAIGFKIGATTQAAVNVLNVSGPFFGCLFAQFSHCSGEDVELPSEHNALLETEFVVRLSSDLPPREHEYSVAEIADATDWVCPGFEIVATRFAIELPGHGRLLIADGGVNLDFVAGPACRDWRNFDLATHRAVLEINGKHVGVGVGGDSLFGHPLMAVGWLAGHEQLRERGLKAGDLITTGSCTGLVPVAAGDQARASFGEMGEVTARFVAA